MILGPRFNDAVVVTRPAIRPNRAPRMPETNDSRAWTAPPVSASGSRSSTITMVPDNRDQGERDDERERQDQQFDRRPVPHIRLQQQEPEGEQPTANQPNVAVKSCSGQAMNAATAARTVATRNSDLRGFGLPGEDVREHQVPGLDSICFDRALSARRVTGAPVSKPTRGCRPDGVLGSGAVDRPAR